MYGLTATITSVVLGREIEPRTVRQWVGYPAVKPQKPPLKRRLLKFRKRRHLSGSVNRMDQTCSTNGSPSRRRRLRSDKSVRTLRKWRGQGVGPPYAYFGRTIRYRKPALVEHYRQSEINPVRALTKQRTNRS